MSLAVEPPARQSPGIGTAPYRGAMGWPGAPRNRPGPGRPATNGRDQSRTDRRWPRVDAEDRAASSDTIAAAGLVTYAVSLARPRPGVPDKRRRQSGRRGLR